MTDVFYEDLAKTRQQIHQHPEVSEDEHETTIFLKGYLRKLGIEPLNYPLKTGLIAEIGSGHPIIALRADIDALPIQENTGLSYASENGAMHACGHDFHQTSLLGAAQILKEREAVSYHRLSQQSSLETGTDWSSFRCDYGRCGAV